MTISEGANVLGSAYVNADGGWSYSPNLPDGVHTLTAMETDLAGNIGQSSITITLDTKPPVVTAGFATTSDPTPRFALAGSAESPEVNPGHGFVVVSEGIQALAVEPVDDAGHWSYPSMLTPGFHHVVVNQSDAAGNIGFTVVDVIIPSGDPASATMVTTPANANNPPPVVNLSDDPEATNTISADLGTAQPGFGYDPLTVALISDTTFTSDSHIDLVKGELLYTPGLIDASNTGNDVIEFRVVDAV